MIARLASDGSPEGSHSQEIGNADETGSVPVASTGNVASEISIGAAVRDIPGVAVTTVEAGASVFGIRGGVFFAFIQLNAKIISIDKAKQRINRFSVSMIFNCFYILGVSDRISGYGVFGLRVSVANPRLLDEMDGISQDVSMPKNRLLQGQSRK